MAGLRSSNRTTPRKRYTIDAFEGIDSLILESSSSDEEEPDTVDDAQDEADADADAYESGAEPSESDNDAMSGVEFEVEEASEQASDAGERDLNDNISIASDPGVPTFVRGQKWKHVAVPEAERRYTRGTPDNIHNRVSKKERRKYYFGPEKDDVEVIMKARARWGIETCLPSRKANKSGHGGFAYSASYEKAINDAQLNWKWYGPEGGEKNFRQRQQVRMMTKIDAQDYMPVDSPSDRHFVMGPVNKQELYTLQLRQALTLHEPFETDPEPGQNWKEVRPPEYKSGFMLNLGARVHCLDWAPSQPEGKQYLAVAVLPSRPSDEQPEAPAFTPHPLHLSSIQIWEFSATSSGHVDKTKPPRLALVIGAEMGDIKALKWCPVPRRRSDKVGLLACISYDGFLRVIDVEKPDGPNTVYRQIETFAIESKPPSTVCTCLTWIDSQRVAAGCANGCVAIWDLAECLKSEESNPRPTSYASIHTSYILAITTAWPSFPNMLMTTSISGHSTLTDISRPLLDPSASAVAARVRCGYNTLAWLEHAKCALSIEDNLMLKAFPLRRWFSTIGTGRMKSLPMCIATSPCHPFVLMGSSGGEVSGNNPVRRIIDGGKISMWQQDWFRHEWRRPTEEEIAAERSFTAGGTAEQTNGSSQSQERPKLDSAVKAKIGKPGLSRISEGFKATKIVLGGQASAPGFKNGVPLKTVYEENTAITALAWNPNLLVAGWAAAGMADGLLRVEDIAA